MLAYGTQIARVVVILLKFFYLTTLEFLDVGKSPF